MMHGHCKKCGHDRIGGPSYQELGNVLECWCMRCRYSWTEKPLDAQKQPMNLQQFLEHAQDGDA